MTFMNYYISDLHLCYEDSIKKYNRPFSNLKEMHNCFIANWNKTVTDKDTVFILGDVGLPVDKYETNKIIQIIKNLKGRKVLIQGNHDYKLLREIKFRELFEEITIYKEIYDCGKKVILMHYPLEDWKFKEKGSYHLHGHTHTNNISHIDRRLNVCCEKINYVPRRIEELIFLDWSR